MDSDQQKREAAEKALEYVASGMLVGLGTGSTASIFVQLLGAALRRKEFTDIAAVCTSRATEELARREGFNLIDFTRIDEIDLTIDGADEIDDQLRLIKGRGGALLREKIVEQMSKEFVVIADETKRVQRLGTGPLPVEVVRFSSANIERWLQGHNLVASIRRTGKEPFVTDEGHHIIDVRPPAEMDVAMFHSRLKEHAGVVETGFFGHEATRALIATPRGVEVMERRS